MHHSRQLLERLHHSIVRKYSIPRFQLVRRKPQGVRHAQLGCFVEGRDFIRRVGQRQILGHPEALWMIARRLPNEQLGDARDDRVLQDVGAETRH